MVSTFLLYSELKWSLLTSMESFSLLFSFLFLSSALLRHPLLSFPLFPSPLQSYQWLRDKIVSEDGRKQQAKLKELGHIAEKLGCTLPQLAVGKMNPQHFSPVSAPLWSFSSTTACPSLLPALLLLLTLDYCTCCWMDDLSSQEELHIQQAQIVA